MSVRLVTGYEGTGHVTSVDAALFNSGICGNGKYVMQTGTEFEATIDSNNQISIGSGDLVDQGRHISITTNSVEEVAIDNGSFNMSRIDRIVIRYSKDTTTGIESAYINVIKGAEIALGSEPVAPDIIEGDLFDGDIIDDFLLYDVRIDELDITSVDKKFNIMQTIDSYIDKIFPVGSVYLTVSSTNPSEMFGGEWENISNRFIYAVPTTSHAKWYGGSDSITIGLDNLPEHYHIAPEHSHEQTAHVHLMASHTHEVTVDECSALTTSEDGSHQHEYNRSKLAADGTARYAAQTNSSDPSTANTYASGDHTHTVPAHGHTATCEKNAAEYTLFNTDGSKTKTAGNEATSSIGSGKEIAFKPSYVTVYMWIRTA